MSRILVGVLVAIGLMGSAPVALAQEAAGVRFYIVPKAVDANNRARPKYIFAMGLSYNAMDYGIEDTFLVACDPDATQQTTLASNLDVIAIPSGLDSAIGLTALTTVQNKLEGLHVPAGWVTQNTTYRQVLTAVGKMFLFMQRFTALQLRTFFESGVTLDTRINQLTQAQRDALTGAALSLGLDTSSITGSMLIRTALRVIGDQIPGFVLRGEAF
jgi:hypothetical protein